MSMKSVRILVLGILLLIGSNCVSQNRFQFKETWLYTLNEKTGFGNTYTFPFIAYKAGNNAAHTTFSIYYAKDNNWTFVGKITVANGGGAERNPIFFKDGYRVAYATNNEKPIEIVFDSKTWKVD